MCLEIDFIWHFLSFYLIIISCKNQVPIELDSLKNTYLQQSNLGAIKSVIFYGGDFIKI